MAAYSSSLPSRRRLVGLSKQESHPVWVSSLKPLKHVVIGVVPMERSSSSYTSEARSHMMCLCNVKAPLVTSWTKDNLGRRFYGCGLYKVRNNVYRGGCVMVYLLIIFGYFGHIGYR